jgi:formylmethanofuran dehydrogenase subunit E
MLPSLEELLAECEQLHGHLCPGQVLGARMAVLGCQLLGLSDPRGAERKKLIVWVEIDRCLADAIGAVTRVRLGRRSLKFLDYGKVAASFLNTATGKAFRIAALDGSRELADRRYAALDERKTRQMRAYMEASIEELFSVARVKVKYEEADAPGRPRSRVACEKCGEGVNDSREILNTRGQKFCRPCAAGGYYEVID